VRRDGGVADGGGKRGKSGTSLGKKKLPRNDDGRERDADVEHGRLGGRRGVGGQLRGEQLAAERAGHRSRGDRRHRRKAVMAAMAIARRDGEEERLEDGERGEEEADEDLGEDEEGADCSRAPTR
jgi:hypothetical protein